MTFDTFPQSANVICNGTNYGYAPVTRYYDINQETDTVLNIGQCYAQWSSGATAKYNSQMPVYKNEATISTLQRPNGPGYSQDVNFNVQVQQLNAQSRAAAAAEDAAKTARRAAYSNIKCSVSSLGIRTCY